MKVLMLTNIPSPYMVDYLNELGKYCELTAVFERDSSKSRDSSWKKWESKNFRCVILHGINLGGRDADTAICPQVIKYISKKYDHIIVGNPCTPTGIIAVTYMKLLRIPYGFQSEGGFPGNGIGLKEKLKKYIFTGGAFYFSTAPLGDEYFIRYGAEKSKIYRYPFSSLYEKDILKAPVTQEQKIKLRKELKIPYDKVILSVGRFLHYKGHDGLIKACDGFDKEHVGIYIVGGKPTEEYLELKEQLNMDNLHFVDFQNKEMMKKYYMAADVFALNTRNDTWGLVINEAMATGLPIVTTSKCYAALAMLNSCGGTIVDTDDCFGMHNAISAMIKDERNSMGWNNLNVSKLYTIEKMGEDIWKYLQLL